VARARRKFACQAARTYASCLDQVGDGLGALSLPSRRGGEPDEPCAPAFLAMTSAARAQSRMVARTLSLPAHGQRLVCFCACGELLLRDSPPASASLHYPGAMLRTSCSPASILWMWARGARLKRDAITSITKERARFEEGCNYRGCIFFYLRNVL